MKKFKFIFGLVFIVLGAFSLVSCEDDDEAISSTLSGYWQGVLSTTYYDELGLAGDDYITVFYFNQTSYTRGTGYELDYDIYAPQSGRALGYFHWEVSGTTIHLLYNDGTDAYIYNYNLNQNYFSGELDDGTGRYISFRMKYLSSFDMNDYYDYSSAKAFSRGMNSAHMIKGKVIIPADSLKY